MPRVAPAPPPGMRTSTTRDVRQLARSDEDRLIGILGHAGQIECLLGTHDAGEGLANSLVVFGDHHADRVIWDPLLLLTLAANSAN